MPTLQQNNNALRQPWLHDQTHLLLWTFALVVVLLFWFQNILCYITTTTFIGSEEHLVLHDGRWVLSAFEIMALMGLGYAVYALVTLVGVIVSGVSRITAVACVAIIFMAFLNIAQPILHEQMLRKGGERTLEEYRAMLAEGIGDPYVEKQVIEYSRNLEIIVGKNAE